MDIGQATECIHELQGMMEEIKKQISALRMDTKILAGALIDQQRNGQIDPGTMEELEVMK